jgi:hypothetical protein
MNNLVYVVIAYDEYYEKIAEVVVLETIEEAQIIYLHLCEAYKGHNVTLASRGIGEIPLRLKEKLNK